MIRSAYKEAVKDPRLAYICHEIRIGQFIDEIG